MSRRYDEELTRLQEELLAAEDEFYESEEEEEFDEEAYLDPEDIESYGDEDDVDDVDDVDDAIHIVGQRYGRGRPKKFQDRNFFENDVDDAEMLSKKDYQKAKRNIARKNIGLVILAILELAAIAAVLIWWASWVR